MASACCIENRLEKSLHAPWNDLEKRIHSHLPLDKRAGCTYSRKLIGEADWTMCNIYVGNKSQRRRNNQSY